MEKKRKNRSEKREDRRKEEATKQTDQNDQYSKMFEYDPKDLIGRQILHQSYQGSPACASLPP